jgi:hypothetical protein
MSGVVTFERIGSGTRMSDLAKFADTDAALGGSRASGLSRILRRFAGRYGRRRWPSAFCSRHERERVDVTRLDRSGDERARIAV